MAGLDAFKETGFLLKFIALIANIVALAFWVMKDSNIENVPVDKFRLTKDTPAISANFSQMMLFYHCVPAFVVILTGLVIVYLVEDAPGKWAQRIFGGTGAILFIVFGILGIINALGDKGSSHELVVAALCATVGGLLCFDFIKREFL